MKKMFTLIVLLLIVLVACSSPATETTTDLPSGGNESAPAEEATSAEELPAPEEPAEAEEPAPAAEASSLTGEEVSPLIESADKYHPVDITSAPAAMIDAGIYYHLQTMFLEGENKCLEGNQVAEGAALGGAAFMNDCSDAAGELWKIVSLGDGYYHLQTQFLENENKCFEGNGFGSDILGGGSFMDDCQNVSGQAWKFVESEVDGYYRLQTELLAGENKCLEGNRLDPESVLEGAAFMDNCLNVTGQLWKLMPTDFAAAETQDSADVSSGDNKEPAAHAEAVNAYVLDWEPASGNYRLWRFDSKSADPLPGPHVQGGTWGSIRTGHVLIPIGTEYVLDWEPASGNYRLWRFDPTSADPLPGPPVQSGTWGSIGAGHTLIPVGGEHVLDWEPASGNYRLWRFDPTSADPLPGPPVQSGTWGSIGAGHTLIPVGSEYVLDWEPASGNYRLWRFAPTSADPLPGPPVQSGTWGSIGAGHTLIPVGGEHVLDWEPASGNYRLWRFAPTSADPLPGPSVQSGTWGSIREGHTLIPISFLHWSYEGVEGPDYWGRLGYLTCSIGVKQSPVNITNETDADLADVVFNYEDTAVTILNNGHTIEAKYHEGGNSIKIDTITYNLAQFHFHTPSEHEINGQLLDGEMHLVHKNADGTVAVVGVMIKEGAENPAFAPVWAQLPANKHETISGVSINAAELLPDTLTYYAYTGSFTTPPCTEGVQWFVLTTPIEMSAKQITDLHNIIHNNNRPAQPLGERTIVEDITGN